MATVPKIKRYQSNHMSVAFEPQMDKKHHVARIHPHGDAVGAFQLQALYAVQHLVSVRLYRGSKELAKVTRDQLFAANEPMYQSWRIPFLPWNNALSMHVGRVDDVRVILETSERWDNAAALGYELLFVNDADRGLLSSSERAALYCLEGPKERALRTDQWQVAFPVRDPPPTPDGYTIQLAQSEVTARVEDGQLVRIRWPLLLERVEVAALEDAGTGTGTGASLPLFHILCDGKPSQQVSRGGALLMEGLHCYAGALALPYTGLPCAAQDGKHEILGERASRALAVERVDGNGVQLLFRERTSAAQVRLSLYHWEVGKA